MKRKNAGVTVVELVVVLAIMAVVAGLSLASVGSVSGYRARECAKKISSAISANKVVALGKSVTNTGAGPDIWWELKKDGNKVYFVEHNKTSGSDVETTTLVGKGRMTIRCIYNGGATAKELTDDGSETLDLYFQRSTGQLNDMSGNMSNITDIIVIPPHGPKEYDIKVYPLTGKIKATW